MATPGNFGGGSTGPDQIFLGITGTPPSAPGIPFEQKEPDYLLWAPLRSGFASSCTPAGCLLQLKHGLDEGARGAESQRKKMQ
jgi:hypothetical protein